MSTQFQLIDLLYRIIVDISTKEDIIKSIINDTNGIYDGLYHYITLDDNFKTKYIQIKFSPEEEIALYVFLTGLNYEQVIYSIKRIFETLHCELFDKFIQ